MPANRFNAFKDYGIGVGLRVPHYDHSFERKPVVDWFEIISENYMVDGGRATRDARSHSGPVQRGSARRFH